MSTAILQANTSASFTYDLPVTPFGEVFHQLAAPLKEVRPIFRRARYDWWSEDNEQRETVTVGTGVYEIEGTIRFENEPAALVMMLRMALVYNVTLYYEQDSAIFPMQLVAVLGAQDFDEIPLEPDRDRYGYGEWECRLHLRRTDGGILNILCDPNPSQVA